MGDFINFLGNNLADFWTYTGFANATGGHIAMIIIGLVLYLLSCSQRVRADVVNSYRIRYSDR